MTVATQYLLQGWNCRLPGKYKDLLLAIGTEELAHVEMIVVMIDRLLDHVPLKPDSADRSKEAAAGYGQHNPQHAIVNGAGASYIDSMGNPWTGAYVTASGNLMADFQTNAAFEMQGRLQATRLYNMTDDPGIRKMLAFNIARDTMHQNQWLAVIEDLGGFSSQFPIPNSFPQEAEKGEFAYKYFITSTDGKFPEGRWSEGASIDGKGRFEPMKVEPMGAEPVLGPARPDSGAQKEQMDPSSAGKMFFKAD
jgi:Mn-containing catalase